MGKKRQPLVQPPACASGSTTAAEHNKFEAPAKPRQASGAYLLATMSIETCLAYL